MKTLVGIPAYNAERRIEETIERVLAQKVDGVVVVNDGSKDNTLKILDKIIKKHSKVHIITQENKGYGGAHKTMLDYFKHSNFDYFVMLHADGQHFPEEMPPMVAELENGADVVLGSRALGDMIGGGMPYHKWFGNRVLTFIENLSFNTHISSFHCGYKACNKKTVNTLDFENMTSDFHFDSEFLAMTVKNKLKLVEVPITTVYFNDGVSNVKIIKYTYSILEFILKYKIAQIKNYFKKK